MPALHVTCIGTLKKVYPTWLHSGTFWKNGAILLKWSHFFLIIMFEKTAVLSKVVPKQYLKGGHPVDMKMAPLWTHFGFTFSFSVLMLVTSMVDTPVKLQNDRHTMHG